MAEVDFEIKGNPTYISAHTYRCAVSNAVFMLDEFDAGFSGVGDGRGNSVWYIGFLHSNGSLLVRFLSRPRHRRSAIVQQDNSISVANELISGVDVIERKGEVPRYLSEIGLKRAEKLSQLIGKNGAAGFSFTAAKKSAVVTQKTAENIHGLLEIKKTAIGTVEGHLDGVNIHRNPRFIVYHATTKKAVTCKFDESISLDTIKEYLGRRVLAFGRLQKNSNGDTVRMQAHRIEAVDMEKRFYIPESSDLQIPHFATSPTTEEYLRRIRGG